MPILYYCPALRMSLFTCLLSFVCIVSRAVPLPGCLCSLVSFYLPPSVPSGVRLSFSLSRFLSFSLSLSLSLLVFFHLSPSEPSGVRLFGSFSSLVSLYLCPSIPSAARLSGCLSSIIYLPSLVSQSGWCPALWMCLFTCFPSFVSHSV